MPYYQQLFLNYTGIVDALKNQSLENDFYFSPRKVISGVNWRNMDLMKDTPQDNRDAYMTSMKANDPNFQPFNLIAEQIPQSQYMKIQFGIKGCGPRGHIIMLCQKNSIKLWILHLIAQFSDSIKKIFSANSMLYAQNLIKIKVISKPTSSNKYHISSLQRFGEHDDQVITSFKFEEDHNESPKMFEYKRKPQLQQGPYQYGSVFFMDTEKDRSISLGRDYTYPKLGKGECYFNSQVQRDGFAKVGDTIEISAYSVGFNKVLIQHYNTLALKFGWKVITSFDNYYNMFFKCTVKDFLDGFYGKFDEGYSPYGIIMELDTFFELLADYKNPDIRVYQGTQFDSFLREYTSPQEFSDQILLNLPSPRIDYYASNDFESNNK